MRTGSKDRPIDPMSGTIASAAKKLDPGSNSWLCSGGRQPFMPWSISQSLPLRLSPSICPREADAAAFRRARSGAVHPAKAYGNNILILMSRICCLVKAAGASVVNARVPATRIGSRSRREAATQARVSVEPIPVAYVCAAKPRYVRSARHTNRSVAIATVWLIVR